MRTSWTTRSGCSDLSIRKWWDLINSIWLSLWWRTSYWNNWRWKFTTLFLGGSSRSLSILTFCWICLFSFLWKWRSMWFLFSSITSRTRTSGCISSIVDSSIFVRSRWKKWSRIWIWSRSRTYQDLFIKIARLNIRSNKITCKLPTGYFKTTAI